MTKAPLTLEFVTTLYSIKEWVILPLPQEASEALPSRGQVSMAGTVNGCEVVTVLEPDGRWGHWMRVSDALQQQAGIRAGDEVRVRLTTGAAWPEPQVPDDVEVALADAPDMVKEKWQDITPMARWEWVRWIRATANPETRAIRIEKTMSKLSGKHRRPCCFNLAACTEPYVAKNSQLLPPSGGEGLSTPSA